MAIQSPDFSTLVVNEGDEGWWSLNIFIRICYIASIHKLKGKIEKIIYMKSHYELTAIIEREGDGYVSLCPELDIASQGDTIEEARANLIEALELFFETASQEEISERLHDEVLITRVRVSI